MRPPVTVTVCPPGVARDALGPGRWAGLDAPAQELTGDRGTFFAPKPSTGKRRPPIRPDMARSEVDDG